MRINRNRSRLTFRKRRRSGFLSFAVLIGLILSFVALSWNRIGQLFNTSPQTSTSLRAVEQAFARGDLDTTITLARQLMDSDPEQAEAALLWLTRALIYRSYTDYDHAGDRQSALEATTEALKTAPRSTTVMAAHALALQAQGDPSQAAQAADLAQKVLNAEPGNAVARTALGLSYGGVGSFDFALREIQQALDSAPLGDLGVRLDAQRALAVAYSDLGRYSDAIQAIERAIAMNTRLTPLYFERALYALQVGDADAATVAYFQILAYDSKNAKAHLRLCELSSLLREGEAALSYCAEVTELAPNWADGWYQLGREYFLQSSFRAAEDALHTCTTLQVMQGVKIEDRRFECWYLQGQAAEILGDCAGLVATYNEFRAMAAEAAIPQTWTYPPEGPPGCPSTPPGG